MIGKYRVVLAVLGPAALSACVAPSGGEHATGLPPPPAARYGPPQPLVGYDARRLIARFGEPRLDIRDRTVRKLQFMAGGCVLDAYLYATARGREPTVTHIDTRTPDGTDIDPARCGINQP